MEVLTFETSSLGDRTYLVTDGCAAVVVDPQRDIGRIVDVLERRKLSLDYVFETHLHNDYVSGGLELSRVMGADYVVAASESVGFARRPVVDGDQLRAGSLTVSVMATPGHTPHHLSYVVTGDDGDRAAFSGGSLLFGTVGRTDLFGAELTDTLSRAQHRSARQLANAVSPTTPLHPTHGFGSLCASTQVHRDASTIADQLEENIALLIDDEDEFVTRLIDGFGSYPGYYAHLGAINRAGPAPIDLRPMPALAAQELVNRLDHGALVVDLRPRRSFAADHVLGTVNVEMADPFAMYVGWLWPDQPVTMVCDSQDEATDAQLALARIGVDRPAGVAYHSALRHMHLPRARVHVAGFADLARARQRGPLTVLDVRRHDEVVRARLEGSCHVELPSIPALATRRGRSPRRMWVHCASGYRAAIACSVLHAAGHDVVLIDDRLDQADAAGCEVLTDLA